MTEKTFAAQHRELRDMEIVKLYNDGLEPADIATKVGCAVPTVYLALKGAGVELRTISEESRKSMAYLYNTTDMTLKEVADKFEVSYSTVYQASKKYGVSKDTESSQEPQQDTPEPSGGSHVESIREVFELMKSKEVSLEELSAYTVLYGKDKKEQPKKTRDFLNVDIH